MIGALPDLAAWDRSSPAPEALARPASSGGDFVAFFGEGGFGLAQGLGQAGTAKRFAGVGAEFAQVELFGLVVSGVVVARVAEFIPTPYPVDSPAWDFSIPLDRRSGLFFGTREFDVPSRNHLAAVALADCLSRELSCPVTVMNADGRRGAAILAPFRNSNSNFRILNGPLPYPAYLEEMARHRIVWQLDSSAVPGQVAGDALLCGMPCLGGNGAVDRLVFPDPSPTASREAFLEQAKKLLTDDNRWLAESTRSRRLALETLAFPVIAQRLKTLQSNLAG